MLRRSVWLSGPLTKHRLHALVQFIELTNDIVLAGFKIVKKCGRRVHKRGVNR